MADTTVTSSAPTDVDVDVLILPVLAAEGETGTARALGLDGLESAVGAVAHKGGLEEVVRIPAPEGVAAKAVVLAGLGESELSAVDPESLRRGIGAAARRLNARPTVLT